MSNSTVQDKFQIGQTVTVSCAGHRKDGATGTVIYYGDFMGTWGVQIDGEDFGFWPSELRAAL